VRLTAWLRRRPSVLIQMWVHLASFPALISAGRPGDIVAVR